MTKKFLQYRKYQTLRQVTKRPKVAKRPGIETSKSAKRPSGESSTWRTVQVAKRPGSELSKVAAKRPGGELAK